MSNVMVNFGDVPVVAAVVPVASFNADANGTGVDIYEYSGEAAVTLQASAGTGDMTLDVKLQHSDVVGSGYTDITGAAFTQVTTTASTQKISINTNETKRYVRAVVDVGGTTPEFIVGVSLLGIKG